MIVVDNGEPDVDRVAPAVLDETAAKTAICQLKDGVKNESDRTGSCCQSVHCAAANHLKKVGFQISRHRKAIPKLGRRRLYRPTKMELH